jgi:hypothetical protein
MAITNYYVRATNGVDAAGGGTTHMTAYKTPQFALDDIGGTHGQGAQGDQINICATTAEGANVLAGSLSIATYGTPTTIRPLVLRGYTAVANDGGVGEINCGGNTMWAATTYDHIYLKHLELHTFNAADIGIALDQYCVLDECEVHRGASAPVNKWLVVMRAVSKVIKSYIHDPGEQGTCLYLSSYSCLAENNFIDTGAAATAVGISLSAPMGSSAVGNIVRCGATGAIGIYHSSNGPALIAGNVVTNLTAGTVQGIYAGATAGQQGGPVLNNIVCGWSGAGGVGIAAAGSILALGYNAFYNNTAAYSVAGNAVLDETAHDVVLAADPFVDAANGNFALTDAAKLALRSAGWPASYLGANTDPHITIGAVQYGAAEAGGSIIRKPIILRRF